MGKDSEYKIVSRLFDENERPDMTLDEKIEAIYAGIHWQYKWIADMDLENKEVLILIGPSRVGKGTLLEAIKGTKMKFWDDRNDEHPEWGES